MSFAITDVVIDPSRLNEVKDYVNAEVNEIIANDEVSTTIDPARLEEVKDWIENTKYTLDIKLQDILSSSINTQENRLAELIDFLLQKSGSKSNEFLMRNVLLRTQIAYESFNEVPSSPKRDALARRVLLEGLQWAQRMYEPDLNLMKASREGRLVEVLRGVEFAKLGIEWAEYMLSLYYLSPDNEARLRLMKNMMGIMYNDINNDDAVKRILAPISGAVVAKNEDLQRANTSKTRQKLLVARDLRRFMEQQIAYAEEIIKIYTNRLAQEEADRKARLIQQIQQQEIAIRAQELRELRKIEEREAAAREAQRLLDKKVEEQARQQRIQARLLGSQLVDAYDLDLTKSLLAQGADVTYQKPGYNDALQNASMDESNEGTEQVRLLLAHGADAVVNRRGIANMTALHWAAFNGNLETVRLLLEAGASTMITVRIDGINQRASDVARSKGHYDIVQLLDVYASEGQ
jgi:hypothetical protein